MNTLHKILGLMSLNELLGLRGFCMKRQGNNAVTIAAIDKEVKLRNESVNQKNY